MPFEFNDKPAMTATKAVVAGVGNTTAAILTALASVNIVISDDAIDAGEVGTLVTAGVILLSTVYGVWKVPNKPKSGQNYTE